MINTGKLLSDGSDYKYLSTLFPISSLQPWDDPKSFKGGKLYFKEYDYSPYMENNTMVLFPSFEQHEVTKVQGNGRFSVNQFYFINR